MSVEKEFVSPVFSAISGHKSPSFKHSVSKILGKIWGTTPSKSFPSFTVQCVTTTHLSFHPKDNKNDFSFSFRFEGKEEPLSSNRCFFTDCSLLTISVDSSFNITSSNYFWHSSGIAFRFRRMSALALAIASIEKQES